MVRVRGNLDSQASAYQGNNLARLRNEPVSDLFVELDQVANVYVAVVFLEQRILAQLVSVDEAIIESEVKNEGLELCADLAVCVLVLAK